MRSLESVGKDRMYASVLPFKTRESVFILEVARGSVRLYRFFLVSRAVWYRVARLSPSVGHPGSTGVTLSLAVGIFRCYASASFYGNS